MWYLFSQVGTLHHSAWCIGKKKESRGKFPLSSSSHMKNAGVAVLPSWTLIAGVPMQMTIFPHFWELLIAVEINFFNERIFDTFIFSF